MHKASASSAGVARPDEKMSRRITQRKRWVVGGKVFEVRPGTSLQRQVQKKNANAKRRRRDRQVEG